MIGRVSVCVSLKPISISVRKEFRLQLATQTRFQAVYPLNVWNQMHDKNYYYR